MISQAGWWTQTPFATPLQPIKWNAHFWITFTLDDWPGWSMDSNPIHHPFPANKMKCSFLDYVQLLMISWACQWTWTPSTTCLQPKRWNAHILIMFIFRWLAGLVNGLEPHPPPLSSQKNEILIFGLHSTSDVGQTGQWTQTPSTTPLQPIKWNAHFWITLNFWWSAGLVNGIEPHLPALFIQKKWNATFWIMFNFWWTAGLVNGLKPHPPPVSSQKDEMLIFWLCSLQMISWAGQGLEPHPPPFSSQKNEILIFVLRSTSDVGQTSQWTQTPSTTPLQPIKWNASFWIMFTTDDQPGWSMDSNPICHPSPAKKMKCPYFDYVQLLMTGRAGQWTRKKMKCSSLDYVHFWWSAWLIDELEPHLPPLSYQKKEMLNFQLCSTSDDRPDWSMDSNPIHHPSPAKNMKCSFFYYI